MTICYGHARRFTLIELLMVIAIIIILAGMLLPVAMRAVEMGRQASCYSNVRQLVMAGLLYAEDNKQYWVGYIPGSDRKELLFPYTTAGASNDDISDDQIWFCLGTDDPENEAGYGFNTNMGFVMMQAIRDPLNTVSVCDAGVNDSQDPITATHVFPPSRTTFPVIGRPNPRHLLKVNVAFMDGHVDFMKMTEPFYPNVAGLWTGNGITDPDDPQYKDELWDLY